MGGFMPDLIWDVEDGGPVWFRTPWPPTAADMRDVDRIVHEHVDRVWPVLARFGQSVVDVDGDVRGVHFRKDGRVEGRIPALTRASRTGVGRLRDARLVQFTMTPDGRITMDPFLESVPLPSAVRALRAWLRRHEAGLRVQRGRGAYRRGGVYVRFGRWGSQGSRVFLDTPTEETSHGGEQGFDRKREDGVSVYRATPRPDGGYDLVGPNPREAIYGIGSDYVPRMLRQFRTRILSGDVYLLAGTRVSYDGERVYGADGEPVLDPASIRVLAALGPDEVYWAGRPMSAWINGAPVRS